MKLRNILIVSFALALIAAACSSSDDVADTADAAPADAAVDAAVDAIQKAEIGKPAPNFTLELYENGIYPAGQAFSLSELRGKPVVINFWYPACGSCGDTLQLLKDSYDINKDTVHYVGVHVPIENAKDAVWSQGTGAKEGQDFVSSRGMPFISGPDTDQSIAEAYEIQAYPTAYFLDKDLNVVSKETFLRAPQIRSAIANASE